MRELCTRYQAGFREPAGLQGGHKIIRTDEQEGPCCRKEGAKLRRLGHRTPGALHQVGHSTGQQLMCTEHILRWALLYGLITSQDLFKASFPAIGHLPRFSELVSDRAKDIAQVSSSPYRVTHHVAMRALP